MILQDLCIEYILDNNITTNDEYINNLILLYKIVKIYSYNFNFIRYLNGSSLIKYKN